MTLHLPAAGRPVPTSTYRFQLTPDFGFADVADQAGHLASLGVSHAYLSPVLQAAPGSQHGYDVVDHSRLSADLGGEDAFRAMAARLREHGVGVVVDVVPNHMAAPEPEHLNRQLWSVLREGRASRYASWFDVEWAAQDGRLLMPVLGGAIGEVLAAGELTLDRDGGPDGAPVLRYYDHVFPVAEGTAHLPLEQLVTAQHYRLALWRVAGEELNYRRFFDVTTLIAIRVEDPDVFDESHALLLQLVDEGLVDGLRIDHPDGLHDPRGYLRRLADRTGGSWVAAEKILEVGEHLPADWPCAGTTGYDALRLANGVLVDPDGEAPLTTLYAELTGEDAGFETVVGRGKAYVSAQVLSAELTRLTDLLDRIRLADLRLRDLTRRQLRAALRQLLVEFPVYRAYVVPGEEPPAESVRVLDQAADAARAALSAHGSAGEAGTVDVIRDLALLRCGSSPDQVEFAMRFQQTCGPVMAKGVEDTAFYRYLRFTALNEVGGDPGVFGVGVQEFHDGAVERQRDWPFTMTTLSTHDTKRSEDVRARITALSEVPAAWGSALTELRSAAAAHRSPAGPDAATENLVWQTLVGAWPIDRERLQGYLSKATREAKVHTTWTEPDEAYDDAVASFCAAVVDDRALVARLEALLAQLAPGVRANVLGQKLLQLTMPGVPDTYQGSELVDLSLVDPDNRRPVDYAQRAAALAALDAGTPTGVGALDAEKLRVTATALRLRRELPGAFGPEGAHEPVAADGSGAGHVVAFTRGGRVAAVVTRLALRLAGRGGWGDTVLQLPAGTWTDRLTGREHEVSGVGLPLADLLPDSPVALLVRTETSA